MKLYLPVINFIALVVLVVVSVLIHRQERRIIDLQMRTIEAQQHNLELWKARAMQCEGIVVGSCKECPADAHRIVDAVPRDIGLEERHFPQGH
jgi:hypothetical protein